MLALFIAVSLALMILAVAEVWPGPVTAEAGAIAPLTSRRRAGPTAVPAQDAAPEKAPAEPPQAAPDEDAIILDRLARLLIESTAPQPLPPNPPSGDLPRITGFRPGDVIEVELDGPLPRPEDLRFEQSGRDATLILDGFAALIVEGVSARTLRPAHLRFRSSRAA